MFIPNSFNKAVADVFYDKEIFTVEKLSTVDVEGGRSISAGVKMDSFMGNVKFTDLRKIQEDYGLREQIDIAVTTDPASAVKVGDLIKYQDNVYDIIAAVPSDSHLLIGGQKWR